MTRRILRYEIPVDGRWHQVTRPRGPIVHVAARTPHTVEMWALAGADDPPLTLTCSYRVFGTGEDLPDEAARHIGTALAAEGRLVWHLMADQ
jgi:hypothetical protein